MSIAETKNSPMILGTSPVGKLIVQYSIPAIIACIATSLYNIIDSIFIGRGVGAMAIAGLAITFPLMNLVVGFCTLVAAGGATMSSIFLGQKDKKKATAVVNNVMTLCLLHSVAFGGLTLCFLDDVLSVFGATQETIGYAKEFMRIILLGTPISYVFIGLNNLMRATGYPKKAMVSALLSVLVNIFVAPICIFVFNWGIAGAALATIISQFCAFLWVISHFLSHKSFIRFDWKNNWFDWKIIRRIYTIGLSPFLMNLCACVIVVFLNKSLLEYSYLNDIDGNLAVGAYGIINRTTMVFVMIVFGVTQGMQPILGFNYGAKQWTRVKHTLKIGMCVGFVITTIGFVITQLFPDLISSLFTTDKQLIAIARSGFHIFFLFYPIVGVQIVIQNYFQSIGKPKMSIFLSLTRQLIFILPFLALLPPRFGVSGVWASIACADIMAFILAIITIIISIRNTNAKLLAEKQ